MEVRTLADAERAHIVATLRETNWVVGGAFGAAARLGLPRTSLISRMQRLGLSKDAGVYGVKQPAHRRPPEPWTPASAEGRLFNVAAAGYGGSDRGYSYAR
jgi:hypothetical protein